MYHLTMDCLSDTKAYLTSQEGGSWITKLQFSHIQSLTAWELRKDGTPRNLEKKGYVEPVTKESLRMSNTAPLT